MSSEFPLIKCNNIYIEPPSEELHISSVYSFTFSITMESTLHKWEQLMYIIKKYKQLVV